MVRLSHLAIHLFLRHNPKSWTAGLMKIYLGDIVIIPKFRYLSWMLAFITLLRGIGTFWGTPPVSSQEVNEPICYMRTSTRQVVDLSHLCEKSIETNRVQTSGSTQSARPVRRGRNARRSSQPRLNQPFTR